MINRNNWLAMKRFLAWRKSYDNLKPDSLRLEESLLRHVLAWAGSRSLADAPKIQPPFPLYVLHARRDGKDRPLSETYVDKTIRAARRFFRWLRVHENGYTNLTEAYLDTLKKPRFDERPVSREAITLGEVRQLANADVLSLKEERIQAAAVTLFLSGMRVGAFCSLPLTAVNVERLEIQQWPSLGVRTKNGKHSTTYLLNIPDLLAVISAWDAKIRAVLPANGLWFAPLEPTYGELWLEAHVPGVHRDTKLRKDLRAWCQRVDLTYYSPHKFRHGHATYALEQARTVSEYKAVSQNLMHGDLKITDQIYSILSGASVRERIINLGK